MKYVYLFCILFFSLKSFSQNKLPSNYAGLSGGKCFHGSGDLRGFIFTTGYAHYFKKKLVGLLNYPEQYMTDLFQNFLYTMAGK